MDDDVVDQVDGQEPAGGPEAALPQGSEPSQADGGGSDAPGSDPVADFWKANEQVKGDGDAGNADSAKVDGAPAEAGAAEGVKGAAPAGGIDEPAGVPAGQSPDGKAAPSIEDVLKDVGSERSKERIKSWIADHNRLEQEAKAAQETNARFSDLIRSTGMDAQELSQTVEFCRLSRSGSPDDLQVALDILEQERQSIYDRLGRTAPGSDPLAGFDDLRQAVEDMRMDQAAAEEVAGARRFMARQQSLQRQAAERQRAQADGEARHREQVAVFENRATAFFGQLAQKDPAYAAKEKALMAYLTPERQQELVSSVPPDQWLFHLKGVYDAIRPEPVPPRKLQTPIAARPQAVQKPAIGGNTPAEVIGSIFRNYYGE